MNAALLLALLLALPTTPAAPMKPARPKPGAPAAAPAPRRASAPPLADSLLSQAEAVAWLGGPLEDTFQQEEEASAENGHDHMTVRGWYPKGWNPQTADAPPDRAIQAVVHAFADTAGAERFYGFIHTRDERSVQAAEGPFAGFLVRTLEGVADAAHVKHGDLPGKGGGKVSLATLSFLRGRTFVQMQVWMADGSAVERATRAAKEMSAKLE